MMAEIFSFITLATVIALPPPIVRPAPLRANEEPVTVECQSRTAGEDGLFRLVTTEFVFTNPNGRQMAADFEFPIPEAATVCGYRLEVNGEMVPGVVCEKEKARVAFENEQRRRVDPGIVEHVKGNVWKTRIFPVPANGRRRTEVTYLVPEEGMEDCCVTARWGEHVYTGVRTKAARTATTAESRLNAAKEGWIVWDASLSRKGKTASDRARLRMLPANGKWTLVIFRNVVSAPRTFTSRQDLIAAVEAEPCDGGTDFTALLATLPVDGQMKYLFSDESDTLSLQSPCLDDRSDLVFASRPDTAVRPVSVTREHRPARAADEKEDRLLAIAWAANRIADLSAQADARKDEFLALGREFGVASPVTSLIVLETLEQWIEHKIEPPKELAIHDEWVKRRAAQDDPIARKAANADFEKRLLDLWKQRVEWWKNPKPPKQTPKSGLFNGLRMRRVVSHAAGRAAELPETDGAMGVSGADLGPASPAAAPMAARDKRTSAAAPNAKRSAAATVTLAAWDPKTPYLDAIGKAEKGRAYDVYLEQAEKFGSSPAFYLDCAGWFFRNGAADLARRIISNLAEFRLENVALWRVMGWRLREAGAYDEAVAAFRHARLLRGEEGQSFRDLAIVLAERGKEKHAVADLTEAMQLFAEAAFKNHARRASRRSNDIQVAIVALEELNGLIAWCEAQTWKDAKPVVPTFDEAYRRDLPMDLRIIMSWDADETDIDIHVLEPDGEEAFYGHRRTSNGGFVGEDVTTGYGPEEYLRKEADKGVYKVLSNYYASHQQSLTGAATVTATVYTNWGRKDERRQILTIRLDKPKDKHLIGEVKID